jgi:hypothetical protein
MRLKTTTLICLFLPWLAQAQVDLKYFKGKSQIRLGGGSLKPSQAFLKSGPADLFARNGFQINSALTYGFFRNFGAGIHLDYNQYGFDRAGFAMQQGGPAITQLSSFNSTRFGISVQALLPFRIGKSAVLSLWLEGQAGIRNMNIPKLDLAFGELQNKYLEISYRPRSNTMTYLALCGGAQFFFGRRFGIYMAFQNTPDSRHSIKYSSRAFDADDNLEEGEHLLHQFLGSTGILGGMVFVLGR